MKKVKKSIVLFVLLIFTVLGSITSVYGAGISVYASTSSASIGDTFTVTVSASGVFIEGLSASASGCTILSGIGGTLDNGESKTLTVRLDSPSGGTVTVSGTAADYSTETEYPVAASTFVSAIAPSGAGAGVEAAPSNNVNNNQPKPEREPADDPRSKDESLSGLTVSEGTLTPEFSNDVSEYIVELPENKTSIIIEANANDSKASVTGTGQFDISAGDNEFEITCTSEYGTSRIYKVIVKVDETPLVFTTYNNKKLGVVRNVKSVTAPEGFTEAKVTLDGNEIPAWVNEKINKTIVYLSDEQDNKNFYLFENGKVTSCFINKTILGKELYLIDVPEKVQSMKGMLYGKILIDDIEIEGWTFEDANFKNYSIIYVMDVDGETRYYQYEKTQKVLQLYSGAAPITQESFEKSMSNMKMITVGTSLFGIACIVFGVFLIIKKRKISLIKSDDEADREEASVIDIVSDKEGLE